MTLKEYKQFEAKRDVPEMTAEAAFKILDIDKNGTIDFEEYVLSQLIGNRHKCTAGQFAAACIATYDQNGDGVITKDEMLKVALRYYQQKNMTAYEKQAQIFVDNVFKTVDKNGDGMLTQEELTEAITLMPELRDLL